MERVIWGALPTWVSDYRYGNGGYGSGWGYGDCYGESEIDGTGYGRPRHGKIVMGRFACMD
jgi:hypothetical protein